MAADCAVFAADSLEIMNREELKMYREQVKKKDKDPYNNSTVEFGSCGPNPFATLSYRTKRISLATE